jgi:hypothetical protein
MTWGWGWTQNGLLRCAALAGSVLLAGCGPLRCVGPAKNVTINPWGERCYFAWKGSVRDSLVTRGPAGMVNLYRPLRKAVAWVKFSAWVPENIPEDIDLETFGGVVEPPGGALAKSGRILVGFDVPAEFTVSEVIQTDWEAGGANFTPSAACEGERVALPSASGDACLVRAKSGDAWMDWQTVDGVHVLIQAHSNYSRKRWSPDDLLVVARSMVRLR